MRRLRQLNSFGRMGIHGQPWGWTPAQGLGGGGPFASFLFFDSFTDADGTALGAHTPDFSASGDGWHVLTGAPTIESNRASDNDATAVARTDCGTPDVILEADMVVQGGGNGFNGLLGRWQDATHFWIMGMDVIASRIMVWENNGGIFTERAGNAPGSFPLAPGQAHTIRVETSGTSIQVYIDGGLEASVVSALFQAAQNHGLYNDCAGGGADATWDDFSIRPN